MNTHLRRSCALAALVIGVLGGSRVASAAPVWTGDMETGDLSEWSFLANPEHSQVVSDPVAHGTHAAQIQLTNDAVWPNGLKRVELNHAPEGGRTAEGATTFFAWSFYLPAALPSDPSQQIGYWESNNSWQQMMAFEVTGQDITFSTRRPNNVVQWDAPGVVTPGVWHRLAIGIHFSQDPAVGRVNVWFDGAPVVTDAAAQTLADGNSMFTNVGLLRGAIEFADSPVIVIDDAVEGDAIEDVHPAIDPSTGSGGAGAGGGATSGAGGASSSAGSGGNSGSGASAASGGGSDASGGAATGAGEGDSAGGCSMTAQKGSDASTWAWLVAAALIASRRRGSRGVSSSDARDRSAAD